MLPNFEALENEIIAPGDDGYQCRANQGCHIHKSEFELEQE